MSLFIRIRRALNKLHKKERGLSFRDVVAIIFVYLIIILNMMQTLVTQVNFFWVYILGADSCNANIMCGYLLKVFFDYIYPFKDFITAIAFCFLYYQQGRQQTRFI